MQFVPSCFFVIVMIAATLQSTTATGEPSSPVVANLTSSTAPKARAFIQSLCNATCPMPEEVSECSNLLAPYAVSINGSNTRAVRAAVTVLAAELQALDERLVEFNKSDGQDYELGPCMQVIREAANGAKQQQAELDAAGGGGNQAALAKVNKWYQDVNAKIEKCDPEITDVPRSQVVLKALLALAGVVGAGAGTPK